MLRYLHLQQARFPLRLTAKLFAVIYACLVFNWGTLLGQTSQGKWLPPSSFSKSSVNSVLLLEESKDQLSPEQLVEQIFRLSEPNTTSLVRVSDWMTGYRNENISNDEYDFGIETFMPSPRATNLWAQSYLYQNEAARDAWLKKSRLAAKTRFGLASRQSTDNALHRFVERFFHSEQAEAAIRELAGRQARDGYFAEAIQLLVRLDSRFQRFADSDLPLSFGTFLQNDEQAAAETAAQLILLTAFNNEAVPVEHMKWFDEEFADISGSLGNERGVLTDLLEARVSSLGLLKRRIESQVKATRAPEPTWTVRFDVSDEYSTKWQRISPDIVNRQPILVDDWFAWSNGSAIHVANIADGQPAFPVGGAAKLDSNDFMPEMSYQVWHSAYPASLPTPKSGKRFTARIAGASLNGRPCLFATTHEKQNQIVGLDLSRQGKLLPGFPVRSLNRQWQFDGVPIEHNGFLYVAARQNAATVGEAKLFVNCYELKSIDDGTPLTLRWQTELVQAKSQTAQPTGVTDVGLTLSGNQLFVNSNNGAIAALQIADGSLDWLLTYRRLNWDHEYADYGKWLAQRTGQKPRLHRNVVFVLPADSHLLLAINRHSGLPIWQIPLPSVTDLVHVSDQSVLATGLGQMLWLDRSEGTIAGRYPKRFVNTNPNLINEVTEVYSMLPVPTLANETEIWRDSVGTIDQFKRELDESKDSDEFNKIFINFSHHRETNFTFWQDIAGRRHLLLRDDKMVSFDNHTMRGFVMKQGWDHRENLRIRQQERENRSPNTSPKKETSQ